jgi:hypothetical protein
VRQLAAAFVQASLLAVRDCRFRLVRREQARARKAAASLPHSKAPAALTFLGGKCMDVNRWLRLIAGTFVLASILLGYYVSAKWFFFTGFVALNLIQSAFTNWCPMMTFLRKLGVKA